MQFKIRFLNEILILIYKTAIFEAIRNENIEIIKLLLTNTNLDVNILYIFFNFF